jgi:uncharacterized membrane protein YbhN (UPF0104 family)
MSEKKSRPVKKNWATILRWVGTLASSGLFIWLIQRQKWDVVLNKASDIAVWAVVLAIACYLLSYWFNTLRWCILLWAQQVKITIWQAYRLNWAGYFASQFLPSTVGGDGLRMLAIHPYTGSKTITIGSVVLDRIINMSAMACLLPVSFQVFGTSLLGYLRVSKPGWLTAFWLPVRGLFEKFSPKLSAALQTWRLQPQAFFFAFLAAWPSNLLPITATFLLARQLGMNVSFWEVAGVQTITYFLSVLPISVNGYGLREVAYTTLYTTLGVSLEQASTLALVTRFLMIVCTVPGAIWLSSAVTDNFNLEDGD